MRAKASSHVPNEKHNDEDIHRKQAVDSRKQQQQQQSKPVPAVKAERSRSGVPPQLAAERQRMKKEELHRESSRTTSSKQTLQKIRQLQQAYQEKPVVSKPPPRKPAVDNAEPSRHKAKSTKTYSKVKASVPSPRGGGGGASHVDLYDSVCGALPGDDEQLYHDSHQDEMLMTYCHHEHAHHTDNCRLPYNTPQGWLRNTEAHNIRCDQVADSLKKRTQSPSWKRQDPDVYPWYTDRLPFITGTCSRTYSVTANVQRVLHKMKMVPPPRHVRHRYLMEDDDEQQQQQHDEQHEHEYEHGDSDDGNVVPSAAPLHDVLDAMEDDLERQRMYVRLWFNDGDDRDYEEVKRQCENLLATISKTQKPIHP